MGTLTSGARERSLSRTHAETLVTHDRDPSGSSVTRVPVGLAEAEVALYRQGRACVQAGQFTEALASYQELVRRQPDLAEVWAEMGALHNLAGSLEQATAAYRHVVRVRTGDALGWYNLGALLQN